MRNITHALGARNRGLSVGGNVVRVRCKMKLFLSLAVALLTINRGTTSECPPG